MISDRKKQTYALSHAILMSSVIVVGNFIIA